MKKKDKDASSVRKKISNGVKIYCDIRKCVGCRSCEIACATEHSESKDLARAIKESPRPVKRLTAEATNGSIISLHCQHCEDAPCIWACMSGALSKDKDRGATLQDKDKCVGCWMCVMVCPFGAIVKGIEEKIAFKCDLCPDRDDYACVRACPTGALFVGTKKEFEKTLKEAKK